jgi:hypothetical protein
MATYTRENKLVTRYRGLIKRKRGYGGGGMRIGKELRAACGFCSNLMPVKTLIEKGHTTLSLSLFLYGCLPPSPRPAEP